MTITEITEKTLAIIEQYGFNEIQKEIEGIKPADIKINVAFLGEFSSGKSTLINALLGRKILPAFDEPTNAVITEISQGDTDTFTVIKTTANGETATEISLSDLANEVMQPDLNKKVIITLRDTDFLDEKLLLVDTPGVSSIDQSHEDVTFGYLPLVDVAFITLDCNLGTTPKSLVNFLKQYPKEMLSKMYFIITKHDLKSPEAVESIINEVKDNLSRVHENPQILTVSATQALQALGQEDNAMVEASNIGSVKRIIKEEIPSLKNEVEEKRIRKILKDELLRVTELLRYKKESLSWDNPKLKEEIDRLKADIDKLEEDMKKFESEYNSIKNTILSEMSRVITDYTNVIGAQIAKDEPIDTLVESLLTELESVMTTGFNKIESIRIPSIDKNIGQVIADCVKQDVAHIKTIADLTTDALTAILTIWILPGAGAARVTLTEGAGAAATLAAQKASKLRGAVKTVGKAAKEVGSKSGMLEGLGKLLGGIGKVIKEVNPVEKIKTLVLPYCINSKLRDALERNIHSRFTVVFNEIEAALKDHINKEFMIPVEEKKELLGKARESQKQEIDAVEGIHEQIERDLDTVKEVIDNL